MSAPVSTLMRGYAVSNKKKKQKPDDKADKGKKAKSGPAKAVKTMKALADNPLVADIVAAALAKVDGEDHVRDMILAGESTEAAFRKTGIM